MNWRLILQQCIGNLWARKLRSLLLMLGIIWGTFAITLLLTLGHSFRETNQQAFLKIADGSLLIWLQPTTMPYRGLPADRVLDLKSSEVITMGKALPSVAHISPVNFQEQTLQYQGKSASGMVVGAGTDFDILANLHLQAQGRFFNEQDVERARMVIVLGHQVATELYGKENPLHQTLWLAGRPFQVIGVLEDDNVRMFLRNPRSFYIPYTAYNRIWGDETIPMLWAQPKNLQEIDSTIDDIKFYLSKRLLFDPQDEDVLGVWDTSEVRQFFNGFFGLIEAFLGICGGLALLVGGIGVANTLFLIVRERTTEIGLCLSIGARPKQVLNQFLWESLIIVFISGGIGFILSALVVGVINLLPTQAWLGTLTFTPLNVFIIFALLTVIGLTAGYFPARRAARMTPIQALGFVQ
jgi:putative ABC transport system permease protein